MEEAEHVRVSDCLILENRSAIEKEPVSIRSVKGRENMILDNLVNGKIEIASE
jgi:hypothetical protein